jgi:hypothetical protein
MNLLLDGWINSDLDCLQHNEFYRSYCNYDNTETMAEQGILFVRS